MANRRDLHIGIDGDSRGLDRAVEDAEDSLRGLDRELAKVERQLTAQERVSVRAATAVKQYGNEQGKAALAARKLGTEAKRAAEQAEQAQTRADAAAKAYERGLIDEAKAARAAARAEDATERAAIKAAEAHRAAARAADEQAQQEKKLARDAELAAAAERLGALKARGAVTEHNAALRALEARFGDLSKVGNGAFTQIEASGSKAFSALGSTSYGAIAQVAVAISAVPFAALGAEVAIAGGIGGALAGLGLMATKSDKDVQAALQGMVAHVKSETTQIAAPFKDTWMAIAAEGRKTFDALTPELKKDFAVLAPAITRFVHEAGYSITLLAPAFGAATGAADKLLAALGPKLPDIARNLSHSIEIMANSAGDHADEFANLAVSISNLIPPIAHLIDWTVKLGPVLSPLFGVMTHGGASVSALHDGLVTLSGGLISTDHSLKIAGGSFPTFSEQAAGASNVTSKLAKDMATLSDKTATATERANALNDAFTRLLNPSEAVFTDTTRLKEAVDELAQALAKSHGRLNDNTEAGRAARQAFTGLLDNAKQLAQDMTNSGKSIEDVQHKLAPYILSLYKAAGGNKQATALVDAFVRALGLVPPSKTTRLYNNAAQQKKAVQEYQRQIDRLHGKKVDIYQVMHLTETQAYLNKRKNLLGYAHGGLVRGYASGGQVQSLADGGPSGYVTGPGTTTSDSILTRLSNKEFVVNARATAANLPLLEAINSGRSVPVTTAAVMSGQSGGSSMPIDYNRLAGAFVSAMRREGVGAAYLDGRLISDSSSRQMGRITDQRRRTG